MDLFELIWLLFLLYALLSGFGRSLRGDGRTTRRPRLPRPQDWGWPFDMPGEEEDEEWTGPARPARRAEPARPAPTAHPAEAARPAPAARRPVRPGGRGGRDAPPAAVPPAGSPEEGVGSGEGASSLEGLPEPIIAMEGPGPDSRHPQPLPPPTSGYADTAGGAARRRLADAVAWAVILGPPRAHHPWRPVGWRGEGG